jgi:hypothetical protein
MEVVSYKTGINGSQFDEIFKHLNAGKAVDFACGLKTMYKGNAEHPRFLAHVREWTGNIQRNYKKKYGERHELYFETCSPDDRNCVRIYPPVQNNQGMKHLLSQEY